MATALTVQKHSDQLVQQVYKDCRTDSKMMDVAKAVMANATQATFPLEFKNVSSSQVSKRHQTKQPTCSIECKIMTRLQSHKKHEIWSDD